MGSRHFCLAIYIKCAVDNMRRLVYNLSMIKIQCGGQTTKLITEMKPLQGALKHRTQKDIDELRDSLTTVGLLQPFIMWGEYLLDGHGRYTALMQMSKDDEQIVITKWPVVEVVADDIEQARKSLLEMNARYGKITPKGLEAFLSGSTTITVPARLGVKLPERKVSVKTDERPVITTTVIRLRIQKDKVSQFTSILKDLSYVEIL